MTRIYNGRDTNVIRIYWGDSDHGAFAAKWPCCDVPEYGWAEFDKRGDLVDTCEALRECEPSGGSKEFLADLQAAAVRSGRAPEEWREHPAVANSLMDTEEESGNV
jgi:hypothetical protein